MTNKPERPVSVADDDEGDFVSCESCDNVKVPHEDAIYSEGSYFCPKCHAEWKAEFDVCAHEWVAHVNEHGEDCRICQKCNGIDPDSLPDLVGPASLAASPPPPQGAERDADLEALAQRIAWLERPLSELGCGRAASDCFTVSEILRDLATSKDSLHVGSGSKDSLRTEPTPPAHTELPAEDGEAEFVRSALKQISDLKVDGSWDRSLCAKAIKMAADLASEALRRSRLSPAPTFSRDLGAQGDLRERLASVLRECSQAVEAVDRDSPLHEKINGAFVLLADNNRWNGPTGTNNET